MSVTYVVECQNATLTHKREVHGGLLCAPLVTPELSEVAGFVSAMCKEYGLTFSGWFDVAAFERHATLLPTGIISIWLRCITTNDTPQRLTIHEDTSIHEKRNPAP